MLDTRQYRTKLDCETSAGLSVGARCDTSFDEATTVLGTDQEDWFSGAVTDDEVEPTWDVVAQQIVVHQWRFQPGDDANWNLDQWDGYPTARERFLETLAGAGGTPVVLTGDVHSSWAAELRADFDDPDSDVVGTEFVAAGVASDGSLLEGVVPVLREGDNPHIRYAEAGHRGWILHELNDETWTARYSPSRRPPRPRERDHRGRGHHPLPRQHPLGGLTSGIDRDERIASGVTLPPSFGWSAGELP